MSSQKAVIVTGSSSGFGRLTAETLARRGHVVFAGIRESKGKNTRVADELRALAQAEDIALHVVDLDVTDEASVERAVNETNQTAGRIDVVVNNAGVGSLGPLEAFTLDQVRDQFDTNVFGVIRMNRAVLVHMREQGSGLLIQIGSVLGRLAMPFVGLYSATKFAVEGLTEAYRHELASFGIDAVIVEPGTYPTELARNGVTAGGDRAAPYASSLERVSAAMRAASTNTAHGAPDPQEVADVVVSLVDMPASERPLRTVVVAIEGQGRAPSAINETTDRALRASMNALDLASS